MKFKPKTTTSKAHVIFNLTEGKFVKLLSTFGNRGWTTVKTPNSATKFPMNKRSLEYLEKTFATLESSCADKFGIFTVKTTKIVELE